MEFNANTGLGKIWTDLVRAGDYTEDEVPNLGNLRDVVRAALNPTTATQAEPA